MLDPFADWGGIVEQYDLETKRAELAALPPAPGDWANPASLERLGLDHMPFKMLNRFFDKITPVQLDYLTPCWLWGGGTHDKGYGRFWLGMDSQGHRVWAYTHRVAFEHWIGPIPPGYIGDHQCNHKLCANPTHIWPETNEENLRLADMRRPWKRRNQYSKE